MDIMDSENRGLFNESPSPCGSNINSDDENDVGQLEKTLQEIEKEQEQSCVPETPLKTAELHEPTWESHKPGTVWRRKPKKKKPSNIMEELAANEDSPRKSKNKSKSNGNNDADRDREPEQKPEVEPEPVPDQNLNLNRT